MPLSWGEPIWIELLVPELTQSQSPQAAVVRALAAGAAVLEWVRPSALKPQARVLAEAQLAQRDLPQVIQAEALAPGAPFA
jgi:trans-aconitate methyltransferase